MSSLEMYLYAVGFIYFFAMETGKELNQKGRLTKGELAENVVVSVFWPIVAPLWLIVKLGSVIVRYYADVARGKP